MSQKLPLNYRKHTGRHILKKPLIDNFYRELLALASHVRPASILDAGCGEGFTIDRFKRRNIGQSLIGVELTDLSIELGRSLFPDLMVQRGDIRHLPFKDGSFDLVTCTEVLEHLDDPALGLAELERVSRGHVIVTVPHEPYFRLSNFACGRNVSRFGNDPGHVQHWSAQSFVRFLRAKCHMNVLEVRHPFPWIMVLLDRTP